jgi:hypothetical protein
MTPEDFAALKRAVRLVEHPGLAARLTNIVGMPIELAGKMLPASVSLVVSAAASHALKAAMRVALRSLMLQRRFHASSPVMHRTLAAASGAAGGAFGLTGLPVELPISTVVMLRSIADIARSEGEDLSDPEAALSCMQVFALGGRSRADDVAASGYFAVRGVLANSVTEAARFIARHGVIAEGSPMLVSFLARVSTHFGIVVSQKVAAQALPVIGALGGGAVNYVFAGHFQDMARGHFTVRRLERHYGIDAVQTEYERFAGEL